MNFNCKRLMAYRNGPKNTPRVKESEVDAAITTESIARAKEAMRLRARNVPPSTPSVPSCSTFETKPRAPQLPSVSGGPRAAQKPATSMLTREPLPSGVEKETFDIGIIINEYLHEGRNEPSVLSPLQSPTEKFSRSRSVFSSPSSSSSTSSRASSTSSGSSYSSSSDSESENEHGQSTCPPVLVLPPTHQSLLLVSESDSDEEDLETTRQSNKRPRSERSRLPPNKRAKILKRWASMGFDPSSGDDEPSPSASPPREPLRLRITLGAFPSSTFINAPHAKSDSRPPLPVSPESSSDSEDDHSPSNFPNL